MPRSRRRDSILITLQTLDGVAFHGYLLGTRPDQDGLLDQAMSQMAQVAGDIGLRHLNLWLSTGPMPRDRTIEAIIHKHCPDGGKTIDAYKGGTFISFVAWFMSDDNPDNEKLMEIH